MPSSTPGIRPIPARRHRVDSSHHGVDGGDGHDDVGDHAALAHHGRRLEVGEGRVAEVGAERAGAAVGDDVGTELAARRLDRDVGLAGGDPEALGDQLEVVDQGLHRLAHDVLDVVEAVAHAVAADGQLARPGDLLVADHHRRALEAGQAVDGLLDDAQGLPHLVEADAEAAVGVGGVPGLYVELVVLVAGVGLALAQVPGVPGRTAAAGRRCRGPGSRRGRGGRRPRGGP